MRRLAATLLLLVPPLACAQAGETLLGAGLRSRPTFDGSDDQKADVIPVVRYYGAPWFARTTQGILEGGARAVLGGGLAAGAQLAYEAGPRDDDPGASVGVHLEHDWKIFNLLGRLRHHLDNDRGTQADLRGTLGVYQGHGVLAGVFAQATWADERHAREYYGLRRDGLLYGAAGALGSYELGGRWLAVASFEARRLAGAFAESPFVERRTSYYVSLGLAYRFGSPP